MTIDVNRGAERRIHGGTGIEVWMYCDTPGVYYSTHGVELPEALAAGAGYPVEDYRKEKIKRERLAKAHGAIEKELGLAASGEAPEVVMERAGWKLTRRGETYTVVDDHDNVLNPMPLPSDIARNLFETLAPPVEKEPDPQPKQVAAGSKQPTK